MKKYSGDDEEKVEGEKDGQETDLDAPPPETSESKKVKKPSRASSGGGMAGEMTKDVTSNPVAQAIAGIHDLDKGITAIMQVFPSLMPTLQPVLDQIKQLAMNAVATLATGGNPSAQAAPGMGMMGGMMGMPPAPPPAPVPGAMPPPPGMIPQQ